MRKEEERDIKRADLLEARHEAEKKAAELDRINTDLKDFQIGDGAGAAGREDRMSAIEQEHRALLAKYPHWRRRPLRP